MRPVRISISSGSVCTGCNVMCCVAFHGASRHVNSGRTNWRSSIGRHGLVRVGDLGHDLQRRPGAAVTRQLVRVAAEGDHLGHRAGVHDRQLEVGERQLRRRRQRRRLVLWVVTDHGEGAAELTDADPVRLADRVARPVETRCLAVPHAEHAVVLAGADHVGDLRAPHRRGAELLVQAGDEAHVELVERSRAAGRSPRRGRRRANRGIPRSDPAVRSPARRSARRWSMIVRTIACIPPIAMSPRSAAKRSRSSNVVTVMRPSVSADMPISTSTRRWRCTGSRRTRRCPRWRPRGRGRIASSRRTGPPDRTPRRG